MTILESVILGNHPSEVEIKDEPYEMCDREHHSCNSDCLVYKLNGNAVPDTAKDFDVNRGCDCFKDGGNI